MEVYLKDANQSVEFIENLERIDVDTELKYGGSTTFRDIQILVIFLKLYSNIVENFLQRLVCKHFDESEGSEFIRFNAGVNSDLESDPPSASPSPHLVANCVDK